MKMTMLAAMAAALLAAPAAAAEGNSQVNRALDAAFGTGAWRITGGYRTPEREDQLRAEGALTVRPGRLSRHSVGGHDNPGAYDIVVPGLSPATAAERLRAVDAPFSRYLAEGSHGTQGAHLHVEMASSSQTGAGDGVHRSILVTRLTDAQMAVNRLSQDALQGAPQSQLALGQAYLEGNGVRADPVAAYIWFGMAASNAAAGLELRQSASEAQTAVAARLTPAQVAGARRFVGEPQSAGRCGAAVAQPTVMLLLIADPAGPASCEPGRTSDRPLGVPVALSR